MEPLDRYREIVRRLIEEYASYKPAYGDVRTEAVVDRDRDHYEVVQVGWDAGRRVHGSIIHIDIRDEQGVDRTQWHRRPARRGIGRGRHPPKRHRTRLSSRGTPTIDRLRRRLTVPRRASSIGGYEDFFPPERSDPSDGREQPGGDVMSERIKCPSCGAGLILSETAGKWRATCPRCLAEIDVPVATPASDAVQEQRPAPRGMRRPVRIAVEQWRPFG